MATMLWRPDSRNTKTGPIPQGYVGATRDETERSCEGCPMRRRNKTTGKGGGCYFWNGQATAHSHPCNAVLPNAHRNTPWLTLSTSHAGQQTTCVVQSVVTLASSRATRSRGGTNKLALPDYADFSYTHTSSTPRVRTSSTLPWHPSIPWVVQTKRSSRAGRLPSPSATAKLLAHESHD